MNILGLDTSIVSENLTVCTVRDPIIACVSASLLAAREGGGRKSRRTGRRPPATGRGCRVTAVMRYNGP